MSESFRVSMESPQSGWMSLSLKAGEESLVMAASYAPYDSLRDLIEGLSALLNGSEAVTVKWNCEPEEFDFKLTAQGGVNGVEFKAIRYANHRRRQRDSRLVFSLRGSKLDVCLPFWTALRDLQRRISTDVFASNWKREFPQRELQQLTRLIRSRKRQERLN
ncbi:MAG: hypothetical protein WCF57_08260 [Pyrinomonadaceae bacterium]